MSNCFWLYISSLNVIVADILTCMAIVYTYALHKNAVCDMLNDA